MTLSFKGLLVVMITAMLHVHAFSQEENTALSFYNSGAALVSKNPEQAFQWLEKAMSISQQSKDWDLYLKSINALASLDFDGREELRDKVFEWMKEAVEILRESKEDEPLAQLHYNIARFYYYLTYEIEPPLFHYEQAKKIWVSLEGEWNEKVAKCYHGLGDVNKYYKGDFWEAEENYEKALQIREKIKFNDVRILTRNYYNLATTNNSQQDTEKALSYGIKALEFSSKLGDPIYLEMCNAMLAGIYRALGELDLSKKFYETAIALNKKTNDPGTLAWYYQGLGATLMVDSSYNEALENFSNAYTIYKNKVPDADEKLLFVDLLQLMSKSFRALIDKSFTKRSSNKKTFEAQTQYDRQFFKINRELFNALDRLGMSHGRRASHAFITLGDYYRSKELYDSALLNYQKALVASVKSFSSLNPLDNPRQDTLGFDNVFDILALKAVVFKELFYKTKESLYLKSALQCLILSEEQLSKKRNTLDMENSKWQFLESNFDIYEELLSALYEGIKISPNDSLISLTFRYFEQSKSRSLADALTMAERNRTIGNEDSLFRLHAELKIKLFQVQDNLSKGKENGADIQSINKLREEVVNLDVRIQTCKRTIEEKYPGYFKVKYGYSSPSLQEIQKKLHSEERVLFEYFWGDHSVYAIGISEDDFIFKRIGSADSIKSEINKMLPHFSAVTSKTRSEAYKIFTSSARKLYILLVDPFRPLLVNTRRIQIIPDGSVSQIPFETLLKEDATDKNVNYRSLPYMIKDYTIGYAYSSTMLFQKPSRKASNPSLLAMGFTGGRTLQNKVELEEIQGAKDELEALAKRFSNGRFMTGVDATETNFKNLAPQYDIIHLAIHGRGDVDRNFAASLYFRSNTDSLDDGELHAYELYGLKFKALMAVLTSCESGLGKGYKGEGMISIASAFTYSGCENILLSLWKVNDQASVSLMNDYYGHILEGKTIDAALRLTKLHYLESADELTADPRVWAPMIAYGSLDTIFPKDRTKEVVITALIGAVLFALLLIYLRKANKVA